MPFRHFGDRQKRFAIHDRARRVVREADQQHFCFRGNIFFQCLRRQTETIFLPRRHEYRRAARQRHASRIRHIGRIGDQHFISRIQQRAQSHVDRFRNADRHRDLRLGVVFDAVVFGEQFGDFFTQRQNTGIARVRRFPVFQTCYAGFNDFIRRVEIRFSHAE